MKHRCSATTQQGTLCKKNHIVNSPFCLVHNREEPLTFSTCGICLENTSKNIMLINCDHQFCKDCIYRWLFDNDTCPMCRTKVVFEELLIAREYCILKGIVIPISVKYFKFCKELRITLTRGYTLIGKKYY